MGGGVLENIAMECQILPSRGVIFPLADDGSSTTSLSWGAGSRSQLQPLPLRMAVDHSRLQMDQ